jgi:RNA polymerase sigma-70 factor, ECF subfamily
MLLDSELISGLQTGQKDKFDQIYKQYWAELYAFARKRVNSQEDAKDILQDLFVVIWTKRESLNITTSIKSYLYTALRHRIINYYNSKSTEAEYFDILSKIEHFNDSTDEKVTENEIITIIDKSLDKMPSKMREIFELSRYKGLSAKEIASQLQLSEQTVRNQISNALKYLKIGLIDFIPSIIFFLQNYS